MTSPQQPDVHHPDHPLSGHSPRARVNIWDLISTVAVSIVLVVGAAMAAWISLYYGYARDSCLTADCPPAPLRTDTWFYPVTWAGTLSALVVAAIGPVVSLRWHRPMWIWPVIGIGVVIASYAVGFAVTEFAEPRVHDVLPSVGIPLPFAPST